MAKSKLILVLVLMLTGCTQSFALPIKDSVDKIIIYTEDNKTKIKEYVVQDDIKQVIDDLNKAEKTSFEDPEFRGNIYLIVIQQGKKEKTFIYNDMLQYGGKIYTEKSAKKGHVWRLTNEFGETLLGEERINTLDY
jgi:hypothetical protein